MFMSQKKKAKDLALAIQLRRKSKIITSKKPFEQFDYTEINAFIFSNVLQFKIYNLGIYDNVRIFDSRVVHKIKITLTHKRKNCQIQQANRLTDEKHRPKPELCSPGYGKNEAIYCN
jgi:hypothetical protein